MDRWAPNSGPFATPTLEQEMRDAAAAGDPVVTAELSARPSLLTPALALPSSRRRTNAELLATACRSGSVSAVASLLVKDPRLDPDAASAVSGWTALHWAASHGHVDVIAALVDGVGDGALSWDGKKCTTRRAKVDPVAAGGAGQTPLLLACQVKEYYKS